MTIFGFPLYSFIHLYGIAAVVLIFAAVDAVKGNFEGKKIEQQYGIDDWYRTF